MVNEVGRTVFWLQLTRRQKGKGRMQIDPERNYFCAVKAGQAGRDKGNSGLAHGPATEDGVLSCSGAECGVLCKGGQIHRSQQKVLPRGPHGLHNEALGMPSKSPPIGANTTIHRSSGQMEGTGRRVDKSW